MGNTMLKIPRSKKHKTTDRLCRNLAQTDNVGADGTVIDALGRSVDPHSCYVWTETSVTATFAAAVSSAYLPDCKLHGVMRVSMRPGLHALIEHIRTGTIGLYALNPETARPYLVAECSLDRLLAILRNLPLLGRSA
jgi:hypothetical protein